MQGEIMICARDGAVFRKIFLAAVLVGLLGCDEGSSDSLISDSVSADGDSVAEIQQLDLAAVDDCMEYGHEIRAEGQTNPGCRVADVVVRPDGAILCPVPQVTPVAVITIAEPGSIEPGTVLHLSAEKSFSCEGLEITKWQWDVFGPEPRGRFVPGWSSEMVEFEVKQPGEYKFYLVVYDELGTPSCLPDVREVHCLE